MWLWFGLSSRFLQRGREKWLILATHFPTLFLSISSHFWHPYLFSLPLEHCLFFERSPLEHFWVLAYLVSVKMVRGKTQMRRIENATSRQVTFSKRRNGLLKKAFELSVLCDAEVALVIFSTRGKLYEFASSNMQETIARYQRHVRENQIHKQQPSEENTEQLKLEAASMMKKIEQLEASKRKLLGEGLASCTLEELQQLELQLERSASNIRVRKNQVFKEKIAQLKEKERALAAENSRLSEKCGAQSLSAPEEANNRDQIQNLVLEEGSPISDVETELFIGPPETRTRRFVQ